MMDCTDGIAGTSIVCCRRGRGYTPRWSRPARCCTVTWRATSTSVQRNIRSRCNSAAANRRSWRMCAAGQRWGYDEINFNCGCPSPRVQRGSFGACLMAEPRLVARLRGCDARAVPLPVTVKHRIGIDRVESYGFVRDFVGVVGERGCSVFIVHARNAWLDGLSPKRNREVPPLRHDTVAQLKADFPQCDLRGQWGSGRALADRTRTGPPGRRHARSSCLPRPLAVDRVGGIAFGRRMVAVYRDAVELEMVRYMERRAPRDGTPWTAIARHMMGLRLGQPGARRWRQVWSDHGFARCRPAR